MFKKFLYLIITQLKLTNEHNFVRKSESKLDREQKKGNLPRVEPVQEHVLLCRIQQEHYHHFSLSVICLLLHTTQHSRTIRLLTLPLFYVLLLTMSLFHIAVVKCWIEHKYIKNTDKS